MGFVSFVSLPWLYRCRTAEKKEKEKEQALAVNNPQVFIYVMKELVPAGKKNTTRGSELVSQAEGNLRVASFGTARNCCFRVPTRLRDRYGSNLFDYTPHRTGNHHPPLTVHHGTPSLSFLMGMCVQKALEICRADVP